MQQITTSDTRRIKQISVTNLFGMFNHVIPLNLDDRITIIKGPNGFGKTVILRLLSELFSDDDLLQISRKKDSAIITTPFTKFRVVFDDDSSLQLAKPTTKSLENIEDEEKHPIPQNIAFRYISADGRKETFNFTPPPLALATLPRFLLGRYPRRINGEASGTEDFAKFLGLTLTLGGSSSIEGIEVLPPDSEETVHIPPILNELNKTLSSRKVKEPDWLKELRQSVSVHFIETQRLLNLIKTSKIAQSSMKPTVEAYAEHLIEEIKTKLAESAELSQSLDRTFPKRVLSSIGEKRDITPQELTDRLNKLVEKRSHLMKVGFLDKNEDNDFIKNEDHMDESTIAMLAIYVEDAEKKLEIFKEIADKIDLMTRIIDKHFLYKTMSVTKEKGFVFRTTRNTILSPSDLSSGEQHELVLLYELLFKVKRGSLILIDEPELSLHVVWQIEFLQDLRQVTQLAGLEVLMATHSPDIVDKWDNLTVYLKEPE